MFHPERRLILFCVDQRGFRFRVAEKSLQLFDGHTTTEAGGSESVPELVRIDMDTDPLADLPDDVFQSMGPDLIIWSAGAGPESLGVAFTDPEIFPEADAGLIIEVDDALLVAFPVADTDGALLPVNIFQQDICTFRDAAAGGIQEINQGLFADVLTIPADILQDFS